MDTDVIKLAGFFAAVENDGRSPTTSAARSSRSRAISSCRRSAATRSCHDRTDPSLFIFASLVAPLGGPPWFFITGVAGGFGFNRSLPAPGLMLEHPFLKVMRGEISVSGDAVDRSEEPQHPLRGGEGAALDRRRHPVHRLRLHLRQGGRRDRVRQQVLDADPRHGVVRDRADLLLRDRHRGHRRRREVHDAGAAVAEQLRHPSGHLQPAGRLRAVRLVRRRRTRATSCSRSAATIRCSPSRSTTRS